MSRPGKALARVAVGCVVVVVFEFALYLLALTLFTHLDTPYCAGSNTFCSPGRQAGMTGGAIVVIAGNAAAILIAGAVVALRRRLRWRIFRGSGRR